MLFHNDPEELVHPALAAANRQLRKDTLSIFYGQHTFVINTLPFKDQVELAKKWLCAIENDYLHRINKIEMSLCDDHSIVLEVEAAPWKLPYCDVWANIYGMESIEFCPLGRAYKKVKKDLENLCQGVGTNGFGAEHYITAAEMFLSIASGRCGYGLTDSEDDWDDDDFDSDFDFDLYSEDGEDVEDEECGGTHSGDDLEVNVEDGVGHDDVCIAPLAGKTG